MPQFVELLREPVVIISADGIIAGVSKSATDFFGADSLVVPGGVWRDAIAPMLSDPAHPITDPASYLADEEEREGGAAMLIDDKMFAVNFHIIHLADYPTGGGYSFLFERPEGITPEFERAERAERFVEKLQSMIYHDFRSPFSAYIGLTDLLLKSEKEPLTDRQREILTSLSKSLKGQYQVLDGLMQLSRLYQGKRIPAKTTVDCTRLLAEVVAKASRMTNERNVTLSVKKEGSGLITADQDMVEEAVIIIINNAVKYSSSGGSVELTCDNSVEGEVAVVVADQGAGFEPGCLHRVFDVMDSYTTAGVDGNRGPGFGLLIAKEIAELNGGRIVCSNGVEGGAVVKLVFSTEKQG